MTQIDGLRAVKAVRAALAAAGLPRTSGMNGAACAGWISPNQYGATGFSIRKERDGSLTWHIVLSGKPHLRYRTWREPDGRGGSTQMHEPCNASALHPRIRAVFESLGLVVKGIEEAGYQMHWDDDVEYDVATDRPDWLLDRNQPNALAPSTPTLVTVKIDTARFCCSGLQGRVAAEATSSDTAVYRAPIMTPEHGYPAYADNAGILLTSEAMGAILVANGQVRSYEATEPQQRRATDILRREGDEIVRVSTSGASDQVIARRETITNFWGDTVLAWRLANSRYVTREPEFAPSIPFLLNGDVHDTIPFTTFDAQFGDVPWRRAA